MIRYKSQTVGENVVKKIFNKSRGRLRESGMGESVLDLEDGNGYFDNFFR